MNTKKQVVSVIIGMMLFVAHAVHAMVFDNRYFPLIQKPYLSVENRLSHAAMHAFATTASKAIGMAENDLGIPEMFWRSGHDNDFRLGALSRALDILKCSNPLPSQLRGLDLPFRVEGAIQTQGLEFSYYQSIKEVFGLGFNWFLMRSNSWQEFFAKTTLEANKTDIDDFRRQIFSTIGLVQSYAEQVGMGDLDLYIRGGSYWEYMLKFRRIDFYGRLGALIPTGVKKDLAIPASVPFGGNGHWGMYGQLEAEFALKEDIKAGLFFRLIKRFQRTFLDRISIAGEPQMYGAAVGRVQVNPGFTFVFSPYFVLEGLRQGLGLRLEYTLTNHWADTWTDARVDKTIPINFRAVTDVSEWQADYFSLTVFYDFGKVKTCRELDPILIFTWDIPSLVFESENIIASHKISLGVEYSF